MGQIKCMQWINYGGFVSPSTIDWPGRCTTVIFFRGCPLGCTYCHNASICHGLNHVKLKTIEDIIDENSLFTSGVVFSGGECTSQPGALLHLSKYCKDAGLMVGVQTSGIIPHILGSLIRKDLVDYVSLDVKSTWDKYPEILGNESSIHLIPHIQKSLEMCTGYYLSGKLAEFRVAYTVYDESIIEDVKAQIHPEVPFILQEMGGIIPTSGKEL